VGDLKLIYISIHLNTRGLWSILEYQTKPKEFFSSYSRAASFEKVLKLDFDTKNAYDYN
jgi:hypothetical protein